MNEPTVQVRRATEKLRAAEALAALVFLQNKALKSAEDDPEQDLVARFWNLKNANATN